MREESHNFCTFAQVLRFGRDSRFVLNKILGAVTANFGAGSADSGLSSIAVCSLHGCYGSSLLRCRAPGNRTHGWSALGCWFGVVFVDNFYDP